MCFDRGVPTFDPRISKTDKTDAHQVCVPVEDLELGVKVAYYAARAISIILEL